MILRDSKFFKILFIDISCLRKNSIALFYNFPKVQVAKAFLLGVFRLLFLKACSLNEAKYTSMQDEDGIESEKS